MATAAYVNERQFDVTFSYQSAACYNLLLICQHGKLTILENKRERMPLHDSSIGVHDHLSPVRLAEFVSATSKNYVT
ncbi:hypothetical protein M513_02568 [Trichuris suis]|uniref:Uncharacterized protein n=1 Tax=Trichuris suis TaxID=68888 RepID=A0A085MGW8_9BILA|nr:hypothetical protein M513_02568 [Trichuris suis]